MASSKEKFRRQLKEIETELCFRRWLFFQRNIEAITYEQLRAAKEAFESTRQPLADLVPEAPWGTSPIDQLNRETLYARWQQEERQFAGRSRQDLDFAKAHRHWPEEPCKDRCRERLASDENEAAQTLTGS